MAILMSTLLENLLANNTTTFIVYAFAAFSGYISIIVAVFLALLKFYIKTKPSMEDYLKFGVWIYLAVGLISVIFAGKYYIYDIAIILLNVSAIIVTLITYIKYRQKYDVNLSHYIGNASEEKLNALIEQKAIERLNKSFIKRKIDDTIGSIEIESSHSKLIIEYISSQSKSRAEASINQKIQSFTSSLTIVGAFLGLFTVFSFINLNQMKSDADKILARIEQKSETLSNSLSSLDEESKTIKSRIEKEQEKYISQLIDSTEEKFNSTLKSKLIEEIDAQVKKSKDEIYAAFFENSPQLTKVNKSLESIKAQIQMLKEEIKAISNTSLYKKTSEIQKNSSNIPPP